MKTKNSGRIEETHVHAAKVSKLAEVRDAFQRGRAKLTRLGSGASGLGTVRRKGEGKRPRMEKGGAVWALWIGRTSGKTGWNWLGMALGRG